MKIDSGKPIGTPSARSAGAARQSSGGAFAAHLEASVGGIAPAQGSAPIGRLNVIGALEAVDQQERRRRAARRGNRLLDLLDELRLGLLSGSLSQHVIANLARALGEARTEVDDPDLLALLDEVELRAQVELAKYEQGLKRDKDS